VTLPQALERDGRPPVLYLRRFVKENKPFAHLSRAPAAPLGMPDRSRPTFEAFLGKAINERIGPFVALGNPVDRLPPLGAAREYVDDAQWQDRLLRLANAAQRILVVVTSGGQGLAWELGQLLSEGLAEKLVLLTPPDDDTGTWTANLAQAQRDVARREGAWAEVASVLGRAGYPDVVDYPGPGAVVAFAADGTSRVVRTSAHTVDEYIEALSDVAKARAFW
jgi:hypothetical protein